MTLENTSEKHDSDGLEFRDIEFIQLRYTDVPGRFLAKYIFSDGENLYDQFRSGIGVDGSSVRGFATIDESDMLLVPDRSTLRLVLTSSRHKVAAVIADVYQGFGKGRLVRDPRYVSQRMEEHLMHEGMACQVGPEVECFILDEIIFNGGKEPEIVSAELGGRSKYPIRRKGGYDAPPFQDSLVEFRFDVAEILKKRYHIKATNLNHEVASSGQIEINFMHSTLTKAADNVQIYKDVVRNVARQHDKVANFMPKPLTKTTREAATTARGCTSALACGERRRGPSTTSFMTQATTMQRSARRAGTLSAECWATRRLWPQSSPPR